MALEVLNDNVQRGKILFCRETVRGDDLLLTMENIFFDRRFDLFRFILIDFCQLDKLDMSEAHVKILGELAKTASRKNPKLLIAIAGHSGLDYIMAELCKLLKDAGLSQTVFGRTRDEVEGWVAKKMAARLSLEEKKDN